MVTDDEPNCTKKEPEVSFPYSVDYNDHFETPLVAYQDIQPMLDWLLSSSSSTIATTSNSKEPTTGCDDGVLYDPYYCDGKVQTILRDTLGYRNVVHEKRDFYQDVATNQTPQHNVLITNPPYSDQHKIQCLEFCVKQLKESNIPCCILMPNYVALRQYFRRLVADGRDDDDDLGTSQQNQFCFVVPSCRYQYNHPMGTGKDDSPFDSLWFCGIGKERMQTVQQFWDTSTKKQTSARLAMSLTELEALGVISNKKRPNPKQRKKRKDRWMTSALSTTTSGANGETSARPKHNASSSSPNPANKDSTASKKANSNSKYRDKSGRRTRRRF